MERILRELSCRVGVSGALVMTHDGVVVAAELGGLRDPDPVAALASAAIKRASRAAAELGLGALSRVTLTATFGRLVFVPYDQLVLVVVTDPHLDIELTLLEIAGPARRMLEWSRLGNPA